MFIDKQYDTITQTKVAYCNENIEILTSNIFYILFLWYFISQNHSIKEDGGAKYTLKKVSEEKLQYYEDRITSIIDQIEEGHLTKAFDFTCKKFVQGDYEKKQHGKIKKDIWERTHCSTPR